MAPAPHRVRRLRVSIGARTGAEAFTLRSRLRAELDATILQSLSHAFDEAAPGDDVVRVARLEVRVRVRSLDELAERLREALAAQLSATQQALAVAPVDAERALPDDTGLTPAREVESSPAAALRVYLATGRLPWSLAGLSVDEVRAWRAALTVSLVAEALRALDAPSLHWEALRTRYFRALQLLPDASHAALLMALLGDGWHPVDARLAAVMQHTETLAAGSRHDLLRLRAIVLALARGVWRAHDPPGALLDALFGEHTAEPSAAQTRLDDVWEGSLATLATRLEAAPATPTSAAPPSPPHTDDARLGITVDLAGLVLLHPYLPRFFATVGVNAEGRGALPEASLPRAAALLHLLATGDDEAAEYESPMVKVLLGLDPDEALCVGAGLTDDRDREEVAALLDAVIAHWSALKRTTAQALRGTFLQRRALLRPDARGWRLQIEPRAFDVLLTHLPWSLGIVRLPWMKKAIFTEWPTT